MATRRIVSAAVAAAVPLASIALTSPADAASRWMYKSSAERASTEWVEYGELAGVEGNVHVGYLDARESSSGGEVWGEVVDYLCDEGEVPGGGHGGHIAEYDEEYPEEGYCDVMSYRWIDGGDVTFTVDKKLNTARLTGTLFVDNHGASAAPPVDMTWTGFGDTSRNVWYDKYTSDGETYVYKYDATERSATVDGFIGAMGFTDDADDEAWGSMSITKEFERGSSR